MASLRKRGKVWYYRFVDADGVKRTVKGCSDRRATEDMARDAETQAARIRAGLVDAKDLARREHQARPLSEHLDAWRDAMLHEGNTQKHADQTADRVRRLIAVMNGARPDDIDGKTMTRKEQAAARETIARLVAKARLADLGTERVQAALATFRDAKRSAQTCNHYRAGIRAFARWAWTTGRLRENPLIGLAGYNAKEDRRHDRRTLSLDELTLLIEVAERGPDFRGMTGPARALCYRLAASTGLRYSEIASIRPASFDWKAPSVTVEAAYTKNGDPATLPIPSGLAGDLRPYAATIAPGTPVFPLPEKGAAMLRADLKAAEIPYEDASGLFFDFHALRCQTATLADAAGVSPRVVQKLMRHSSLELTGRYTKPRAVDIEAAASMLPSLKPSGDRPEALEKTGTDGPIGHRQMSDPAGPERQDPEESGSEGPSISKDFGPHLATGGTGNGRELPDAGVMSRSNVPALTNEKPPVYRGLDASGRLQSSAAGNTPERIRTSNLRFRRPMLYPIELRVQVV